MNINKEIDRLNFEDLLLFVFIILCILNIKGDNLEKEYLIYNDSNKKILSNNIFKFTIYISFFIYLYYFFRNYNDYNNISFDKKSLYSVRFFSSVCFIVGTLCLIYFVNRDSDLIGTFEI